MKPTLRLAVIAAVALSLPACSSDPTAETPRQALERLAPSRAESTLDATPPPASYRMTLRRITAASQPDDDGRLVADRVVRTVQRPFTEEEQDGVKRRLGFEQDLPTSVERAVLMRPLPAEPRPDLYPPDAARDAKRSRSVAGRTCRIYLYDDDEYCVDGSGLVLASRRGTTIEVTTSVTVLAEVLRPDAIAASLAGGVSDPTRGSVRPLDPASSPPGRNDWSLPAAPEGFTFVGRYTVVPLTGELLEQGSKGILAGVSDVYVRGFDTIIVDRGGKLDTTAVTEKNIGALLNPVPVELGALGAGQSGIGGVGPFGYREVRALPEKGRYVSVAGTVPVEQLVEVARALRPSPGTTLRYLDSL